MKRYIALDIGDVRIGVAKSDIMGIIASPLETINRKKVKSVSAIEKRKVVDKVAASIILQTYLDMKKLKFLEEGKE